MSIYDLARQMSQNNKDKDRIKTQFDSAEATAYFKFFVDDVNPTDSTTTLVAVDTSGEPAWDREQAWWDNTSSGDKYLWASSSEFTGSSSVHAVVNSGDIHREFFLDARFNNTASSTATWTGGGVLSF